MRRSRWLSRRCEFRHGSFHEVSVQSVTKGILLLLAASFGTFILTFLAIFIPMLIHDMHVAPHDGQGGIGGFVIGLPVAFCMAIISTVMAWRWVKKCGWFSGPSQIDDRNGVADQ